MGRRSCLGGAVDVTRALRCRHAKPPQVAIRKHPLAGGLTAWTAAACLYLALFSAYWLVAAVRCWSQLLLLLPLAAAGANSCCCRQLLLPPVTAAAAAGHSAVAPPCPALAAGAPGVRGARAGRHQTLLQPQAGAEVRLRVHRMCAGRVQGAGWGAQLAGGGEIQARCKRLAAGSRSWPPAWRPPICSLRAARPPGTCLPACLPAASAR